MAVQSAKLNWDPSADSDVAGYKIYYGTASHNYTNVIALGNVTNATVIGLLEGGTYFFAATTYDASGVESGFSNEASYAVPTNSTVPTNQPPSFQPPTLNAINNIPVNENSGSQTVNLSGISLGTVNLSQSPTITAVSSNPALVPNPNVNYTVPNATGTLAFTPAQGVSGTATITVTINNGQPQSNIVSRSFIVTVNPVAQPPTLNAINNISANENSGSQTVNLSGISLGTVNLSQSPTITAVSSNPALVPNPNVNYTVPNATGTLAFTPAQGVSGTATITVTINNGQPQSNIVSRSFTVTVNPVAQPPTLNAIGNLIIVKNSGSHIVNLSGITSGVTNQNQKIKVTAASSSRSLISSLIVNYTSPKTTGTLTLKPGKNVTGTATITVTVNNGSKSNNIVTQKFTVTILAQNVVKPAILNKLTNNVVVAGQSATFNVIATGTGPLKYQWKLNGGSLPAQTNSALVLKNVTTGQSGAYSANVSNVAGSADSASAALIVYSSAAATLTSAASAKGQFTFDVSGVPGYSYVVQASTNLVDWENVQTNTAPCTFTDTDASKYSQRYFRVVSQSQ